jgi:hypothetical protein
VTGHITTMEKSARPRDLSRAELRERGWTDSLIRRYLGEPDRIIKLTSWRTMHVWDPARVESAEATSKWNDDVARAAQRSRRATQVSNRRAIEVRAEAAKRARQLRVRSPRSVAELRRRAIRARQDWYTATDQWDRNAYDADDKTVERWCRNYLRHECSNYKSLLDDLERDFRGVPGVRSIYETIVRPMADQRVDEVYRRLVGKTATTA